MCGRNFRMSCFPGEHGNSEYPDTPNTHEFLECPAFPGILNIMQSLTVSSESFNDDVAPEDEDGDKDEDGREGEDEVEN